MIVQENQSHTDVAILGYGTTAAIFKIADDNSVYVPTTVEPYATIEFPIDLIPGQELLIDKTDPIYNALQKKVLDSHKFKVASL